MPTSFKKLETPGQFVITSIVCDECGQNIQPGSADHATSVVLVADFSQDHDEWIYHDYCYAKVRERILQKPTPA